MNALKMSFFVEQKSKMKSTCKCKSAFHCVFTCDNNFPFHWICRFMPIPDQKPFQSSLLSCSLLGVFFKF